MSMDTLSRNNFCMSSLLTRIMHKRSECIFLIVHVHHRVGVIVPHRFLVALQQGGTPAGWHSSRVVLQQGGAPAGWHSSRAALQQGGTPAGWHSSRVALQQGGTPAGCQTSAGLEPQCRPRGIEKFPLGPPPDDNMLLVGVHDVRHLNGVVGYHLNILGRVGDVRYFRLVRVLTKLPQWEFSMIFKRERRPSFFTILAGDS